MSEVTEISSIEEIRAKRALRAQAEAQAEADQKTVERVVGDTNAAQAAQQAQIQVPVEQRQLEFSAFFKNSDSGVLEDTLVVGVPKIPNGESYVIAQLWKSFSDIHAIVRRDEKKGSYLLYPLDLFSHYEFKFSTVVGVTGALKNVTAE